MHAPRAVTCTAMETQRNVLKPQGHLYSNKADMSHMHNRAFYSTLLCDNIERQQHPTWTIPIEVNGKWRGRRHFLFNLWSIVDVSAQNAASQQDRRKSILSVVCYWCKSTIKACSSWYSLESISSGSNLEAHVNRSHSHSFWNWQAIHITCENGCAPRFG